MEGEKKVSYLILEIDGCCCGSPHILCVYTYLTRADALLLPAEVGGWRRLSLVKVRVRDKKKGGSCMRYILAVLGFLVSLKPLIFLLSPSLSSLEVLGY